MSSPEDLEGRVRRLEQEVERLNARLAEAGRDAAAARLLAGGADRDVAEVRAEFRALTRLLNGLRETQVEDHERLSALEERLVSLEAEMRTGFANVNAGLAQIVTLLSGPGPR